MNIQTEYARNLNVYQLTTLADCGRPESSRGHGAQFLECVQADTIDAIERGELDERRVHEISDGAPSVYTHERWVEFVDLCAYQEDVREYVTDESNPTSMAGVALYLIAERLVRALAIECGVEID